MFHLSGYKLYIFVLILSGKNNKVEEAMALWTQMQEEDTQPSEHFMWSLSQLLIKNNLEVPFTVIQPKDDASNVPSNIKNNLSTQLNLCLKNNNLTKALELHKTLRSKNVSINPTDESKIIELLTRENRSSEATEIAKDMLNNGRPITKHILNFLIKSLSESGDVVNLEYFEKKISKV